MVIAMTAPKEPDDAIDWTGCDAVEVVRGRMSGVPVLRGTRMPVQAVIDNLAAGITPQAPERPQVASRNQQNIPHTPRRSERGH